MGFPFESLRDFLRYLEEKKDLVRVKGEVDKKWEIAYIAKELHKKQGPAVLYENIKGHPDWRLADHVLGTYQRCFTTLNSSRDTVFNDYIKRTSKLVPPQLVDEAPFMEVVQKGDEVDLTKIPVPTWGEHDSGPYITCGVLVNRDPESGSLNMAIYRMQAKDKNRTGVFIHMPKHVAYILANYEKRNEVMPMAVAIGCDPLTLLQGNIEKYVLEVHHPEALQSIDSSLFNNVRRDDSSQRPRLFAADINSLKPIVDSLEAGYYHLMESNLEDVFLKVTGRTLNAGQ